MTRVGLTDLCRESIERVPFIRLIVEYPEGQPVIRRRSLAVSFDGRILDWNRGRVRRLFKNLTDGDSYNLLHPSIPIRSVLADALKKAGCKNKPLMEILRVEERVTLRLFQDLIYPSRRAYYHRRFSWSTD